MKTLHFNVQGMTCSSCEVLIERQLRKIPGVHSASVKQAREEAVIECDDSILPEQLQQAVADKYTLALKDQEVQPTGFFSKNKERLSEIGSVVVILIGAYILLRELNLLPQGLGVTDNMSYGFIFLLGLIAATSTCLAVAGGLLLAVAHKFNERYPHLTGWQKFKPHLYFNIGRILSYTFLGGLIGSLGSTITISSTFSGVVTIIASVLMIIMGLQLLQILPWLNKFQLKMPKFIAHKLYDQGQENKSTSKISAFLFGAATFFLPCGFTQALQLYVLGKADFMIGAVTMLAFSLGTLPSLVGIGAFSSFAKGNIQRYFMTFSAVLVIALGILNISSGATLTGLTILPTTDGINAVNDATVPLIEGKQVVSMEVRGLDYFPDKFIVKKGILVEWNIDGRKAQGCAQIISIPKLKITERLPKDTIKTITFTPSETGKVTFTCGMGMAGPGVFEVIP